MSESTTATLDDVFEVSSHAADGEFETGDADDDTVVLFGELDAKAQNMLIMNRINEGARQITEGEVIELRYMYTKIMGRDVPLELLDAATEISTWRNYSEARWPDDLGD